MLQNDLMSDVCDGELFRSHPLYSSDPLALQIILYYDDVEICNALGANVKKHKVGRVSVIIAGLILFFMSACGILGAFYFILGNLRPRNRSLLHTIHLVALVKTSVIQSYGINEILKPFMTSICKLEEVITHQAYF